MVTSAGFRWPSGFNTGGQIFCPSLFPFLPPQPLSSVFRSFHLSAAGGSNIAENVPRKGANIDIDLKRNLQEQAFGKRRIVDTSGYGCLSSGVLIEGRVNGVGLFRRRVRVLYQQVRKAQRAARIRVEPRRPSSVSRISRWSPQTTTTPLLLLLLLLLLSIGLSVTLWNDLDNERTIYNERTSSHP